MKTLTKFNLTQNENFINSKKECAKIALSKFCYKGEEKAKLEKIATQGFFVDGDSIISFQNSFKYSLNNCPKKGFYFFSL